MADNLVQKILIEAHDATTQGVASAARNLGSLFGVIAGGTVAGNLLSDALGRIAQSALDMALGVAHSVEQLDRLSRNTGVSADKLQIASRVVREGGGSFDLMTNSLGFLNREIAEGNPLLAQLGITSKDAFEVMLQLGRAFSTSDDAAKKNLIGMQLLGRGGKELIADVENLSLKYGELEGAIRSAGAVMDPEALEKGRKLDAQLDRLGRAWEGYSTRIKVALAGAASAILDFNQNGALLKSMPILGPLFSGRAPAPAFTSGGGRGEESGFGGGTGQDTLGGVKVGEESPREKRIKELARLLRMTEAEATRALNKLELLDDKAKRSEILGKLNAKSLAEEMAQASGDTSHGLTIKRLGGPLAQGALRLPGLNVSGLAKEPQLRESGFQRGLADWRETVREVLSTAELMRTSLGAVWNGLHSGFASVFQGLLQKGQTFKSAMGTLFRALANEILASLASIVASELFVMFLRIVGAAASGGGSEIAGGVFSGGPLGLPGGKAMSPMSPGATSSARAGGNTINVYTIDNRSIVGQLTGIGAPWRSAEDRVRFQGAY